MTNLTLTFTIAWRNLLRHKGKSLVIGVILFLGALVMTLGNAVVSGMDRGLRQNIVERFTGHIVLLSEKQETDNALFIPMGKSLEPIYNYIEIKEFLQKKNYIKQFLPAARGTILILNESNDPGFGMILGVNFPAYQKMFLENVQLVEGRFLQEQDKGALLSSGSRDLLYDQINIWYKPQGIALDKSKLNETAKKYQDNLNISDSIVLMGTTNETGASDIRLPVQGIIRYRYLDDFWKMFNIVDIDSFREIFNYINAEEQVVEISKAKQEILDSDNLDDLFGDSDDSLVSKFSGSNAETISEIENQNFFASSEENKNSKEETSAGNKKIDWQAGVFNMVFIKIKDAKRMKWAIDDLNQTFQKNNLQVRAVSWKAAAGQVADIAMIIRGALFGFVLLIFFVAIVIIMNTLSMTAMERAGELGMMRAIGAQKNFIASMFFSETFMLSFVFGGLGIILGIIAVWVINMLGISTDNNLIELVYGGKTFRPYLDLWDVFMGIFELGVVTFIASLYPILLARKITPLEAIARE